MPVNARGITSAEAANRGVERGVKRLRRATDILKTASAFSPRRSSTATSSDHCASVELHHEHRALYGVEASCGARTGAGTLVASSPDVASGPPQA